MEVGQPRIDWGMKSAPFLWLLAFVAGALIPVQAAANAALSRALHGNVPFAAFTLFAVALTATAAAVLVSGAQVPAAAELRVVPWWSLVGGLIVAFYVFSITFLAPRIGVGDAIALIVTGQVMAALTIDHFGLMRSLVVPLTSARAAGAVLMVLGVYLALRR